MKNVFWIVGLPSAIAISAGMRHLFPDKLEPVDLVVYFSSCAIIGVPVGYIIAAIESHINRPKKWSEQ